MKFTEFHSGNYKQQFQYRSFSPTLIDKEWTWEDPRINVLLERATKALGELDAFTLIVPNVDMFINMHIFKEANTSSRIEGTKTRIDEDILDEQYISPEKHNDWKEVNNYVTAINYAIGELSRLPLSLRLLRQAHEILLQDVRGEFKTPGEYRHSQNWIGGASLQDAAYIPPIHEELPELLADFEHFLHNENILVPHLIRIAIAHYQFETIHPFLDGNGRIGRLLITLYLVSKGLLRKPSLYLSDFFEKNRGKYYDALTRVRESNDLGHWVRFFLQGVVETAENGRETFKKILALREQLDHETVKLGRRASNAKKLIERLYANPSITVNHVADLLKIQYASANQLVEKLVELKILVEVTGYSRNRIFMFDAYLHIYMDGNL